MAASESFNETELVVMGLLGLAAFVWWKGGVAGAASAAGGAVVDAAAGAVTGAVDAAGQNLGLPALANITTDPYVARYIIDHPDGGSFEASKWASATAFLRAETMPAYSGHAPIPGSRIEQLFPPVMDFGTPGGW